MPGCVADVSASSEEEHLKVEPSFQNALCGAAALF